ncbi:MAG TPA: ABC transporter ATP-binding protein [Limnochordales bacterium]|nr:ABC transporter ATP-binding protein [Limnochordales bacterium]
MATVVFDRVTKRFGRVRALNDLSVTIPSGTILGLLGPNGAGKSTMLKLIAGLYRPDGGRVTIDGDVPSPKTKAKVAYLPEIDYLYGWMTVRQILDYVRAFYPDWDQVRAEELLRFMALDPAARVSRLSKGMRARLKIVVAMSRSAPLILLDEPLSGIDPPSRSRVLSAIVSEFREDGQTVVMSTHDVAESENLFQEVLFLREGQVALMGDADQLRAQRGKSIRDLFEEVYA